MTSVETYHHINPMNPSDMYQTFCEWHFKLLLHSWLTLYNCKWEWLNLLEPLGTSKFLPELILQLHLKPETWNLEVHLHSTSISAANPARQIRSTRFPTISRILVSMSPKVPPTVVAQWVGVQHPRAETWTHWWSWRISETDPPTTRRRLLAHHRTWSRGRVWSTETSTAQQLSVKKKEPTWRASKHPHFDGLLRILFEEFSIYYISLEYTLRPHGDLFWISLKRESLEAPDNQICTPHSPIGLLHIPYSQDLYSRYVLLAYRVLATVRMYIVVIYYAFPEDCSVFCRIYTTRVSNFLPTWLD